MTEKNHSFDSFDSFSKEQGLFICLESLKITILKENEPFNLELEKGNNYSESYFGDNPEQTIKILEEEGKIKIV